jgi:hypothetical protein
MLTDFHPAYGSCSLAARAGKGSPKILGKMLYRMGTKSAHLAYILPYSAAGAGALSLLLDEMAHMAGHWGACNILAELEEEHPAFESIRRAGYVVYAWQRVWRFLPSAPAAEDGDPQGRKKGNPWRPATSADEVAIRNLYHNLVPPLVQGAESSPGQRLPGLVYRQDGELLGYIEANYGPHGIFLNPLLHPSIDDAFGLLNSLRRSLSPLLNRPVYLAVRSYQAWLEIFLQQMDTEVSHRHGLLVKHLATLQRVTVNARLGVREGVTTEPSAHLVRNIHRSNCSVVAEKVPEFEVFAGAKHPQTPQIRDTSHYS